MSLEKQAERIRVAVNMQAQELLVGWGAVIGLGPRLRPVIGRLTWLGQGVAFRGLLVRFRRFLPPPW
jgi:hypothetical protein